MRSMFAIALLLTCAACSQDDAPAEEVAAAAEEIVDPAAQPSPLARGKWAPRDDCAEIEGADRFRQRLAAAVEGRDADTLVALAADDIKLDFGGGTGTAELRARLADPDYNLWDELEELVGLGCSANEQGGITSPWYFDQDMGEVDPFLFLLVTGEDVPVFKSADASDRIATISWDLVEIVQPDPETAYQHIKLGDGTIGYMEVDKLRSLLDYRLIA